MKRAALVLVALGACSSKRPPAPAPVELAPVVVPDAEPEPVVRRALTAGERDVLVALFAGALDLDAIHVVQDKYVPFQGDDTYMTPENDMFAPGALYLEDFSLPEIEPYVASTLVHEMTHAWQHQNGMDLIAAGAITFAATGGDYQAAYPYILDPTKDLTDYNVEQQASIIEDYYLLKVRQTAPYSLIWDPAVAPDWPKIWAGYHAVLAKFLEDPLYARKLTPEELLKKHSAAVKSARKHEDSD